MAKRKTGASFNTIADFLTSEQREIQLLQREVAAKEKFDARRKRSRHGRGSLVRPKSLVNQ